VDRTRIQQINQNFIASRRIDNKKASELKQIGRQTPLFTVVVNQIGLNQQDDSLRFDFLK